MSHGHNAAFLRNPVDYLSKIAVLTIGSNYGDLDANQPYASIYLNLVSIDSGLKSGNKVVCANFDSNPVGGDSSINASFVPYASEGDVKNNRFLLPALELPPNGRPKFIFTGAMNGCSLVLASNRFGRRYGIHYPNSNGAINKYPLLTKAGYKYEKSIDFYIIDGKPGYGTRVDESRDAPGGGWYNTFSFFYFDIPTRKWMIICQPQIATMTKQTFTGKINGNVIIV